VIGLIVPDIANPFFPPIIRHAQLAAEELGLSVFIADTDDDADREVMMIGRVSPQVEGLIIASSRLPDKSLLTIAQRLPTVLINRDIEGISRVLVSASDALVEGIQHLVNSGHTRIAYVGGPERSWSDAQRHSSVVGTLRDNGLTGIFLRAPAGTYANGVEVSGAVVAAGATAVIAFDDVIAHGLMSGFRARGLKIPEDICILGCDDTLAITTYPSLSSIALDLSQAGRRAVEALRKTGPRGAVIEQRIELEGTLVLRGTTG
jgi:DNA-binding LacI/PurR family transcriptional regulator